MRVILQRVSSASVNIDQKKTAQIAHGLLILLGVETGDELDDIDWLIGKITKMRIFDDPQGKMNLSLLDSGGAALVVSQFTLHASTKKGNRPSFIKAARPEEAQALYQKFCDTLSKKLPEPVETGSFGASMEVSLVNNGPVTISMDSRQRE